MLLNEMYILSKAHAQLATSKYILATPEMNE